MNIGREFEKELAEEFGLDQVPGSGSVWYSKLDLKNIKTRWSLKSTLIERRWPIQVKDIKEALDACFGIGGDGSMPLWVARIPLGDFVLMRKEDFVLMQQGNYELIDTIDRPQVAARKQAAKTPELLRND